MKISWIQYKLSLTNTNLILIINVRAFGVPKVSYQFNKKMHVQFKVGFKFHLNAEYSHTS